jgi:hypothetical protein
MKKIKTLTLVLAMLISLSVTAQTAREVVKKANDAIKTEAMEMQSTLSIYNQRDDVRTRQLATATKKFGEASKTIIRFTAPPDVAGTAMLIHDYDTRDDDLWIYLPALRNTRRILSSEKGKNFMGSEFTNSDMSIPNIDDFEYRLLGEETIDGKNCYVVESKSANAKVEKEYGVSRKVSYIEKTSYLAQKVEHYDLQGKLKREQIIGDYRKQADGSWFAHYMEMMNVQNGRRSVMVVDAYQQGSAMNEDSFSPTILER